MESASPDQQPPEQQPPDQQPPDQQQPPEPPSQPAPPDNEVSFDIAAEDEEDNLKIVGQDECDSAYLLAKRTSSFRCLAQEILSSSSLMKQRLYLFPPPEDPGIDEVFNFIEPSPRVDDIGVEKYVNLCKDLQIVPITRIKTCLEGSTMNLKYYGLTAKQIRALTETLKINSYVQTLILQDNWLDPDMTELVCNMLEENSALRVLNLRECRIGEKGAEKLNEALSSSQFLTELDLSYNDLGDVGLKNIQQGLCDTPSLRKLNIGHNNLTEDSAETLEKILIENKTITDIDLSWNGFFTGPGNKRLFNGFQRSDRIKVLNLAWNGIGTKPAVAPLIKYVKKSQTLEYLDLSSNRLEGITLRMVRSSILKNHSLVLARVGSNPYPPDEAYYMASVMMGKGKDPNDVFKHLDMEYIYLTKDVVPLLAKIQKMGKTINIGGIMGNYEILGPNINKLLFERCRYLLMKPKKKKAKKDFGHFILSLPEAPILRPEFDTLLKKKKIKKLDKDLLDELTNKFTVKKKIDCSGMTKAYMELYPDTCLPVVQKKPKKKKGKGKKKSKKKAAEEEKEIGVVDLENAPEAGTVEKSPSGLNKGSQARLEKESRSNLNRESQMKANRESQVRFNKESQPTLNRVSQPILTRESQPGSNKEIQPTLTKVSQSNLTNRESQALSKSESKRIAFQTTE